MPTTRVRFRSERGIVFRRFPITMFADVPELPKCEICKDTINTEQWAWFCEEFHHFVHDVCETNNCMFHKHSIKAGNKLGHKLCYINLVDDL